MKYYLSSRNINPKFRQDEYAPPVDCEVEMLRTALKGMPSTILDIGSCDGRAGFVITDILNYKPKKLYLTDFNPKFLKRCRENKRKDETFIKIKKTDAKKLNFDSSSIDLIIALGDTFCVIDREDYNSSGKKNNNNATEVFIKCVREALRVLSISGELIFSVDPEYIPDHKDVLTDLLDRSSSQEGFSASVKDVQVEWHGTPLNVKTPWIKKRNFISVKILKKNE
jgi:SAM-dependent methyltransferase